MSASKYFVAVAGNIGVGKSTLTQFIADRLQWEPFFEAVDDNPYLADFYKDMRTWSFHSQIFFLTRRLRHHRQLLDRPNSVVQDRSVYEDAEIFARNLFEQENMTARDYSSYNELYTVLTQFLPPPDVLIYLRASVETLQDRIKKRGREFEQDIEPSYLAQLNRLYEEWIEGFTLCPILIVPSDDLDFVANSGHLNLIIQKIQDKLTGTDEVFFLADEIANASINAA